MKNLKNKLLNGSKIADNILADLYKQQQTLKVKPDLAVILVGDNPASRLYIKLKEKAAKKIGVNFHKYFLKEDCSEQEIIDTIEFLNNDPEINAILVQLPLPKKFNTDKIIKTIDPKKDVDGFHPENKDQKRIIPGLNLAILELIKQAITDDSKNTATIIANSPIFGESLQQTLKTANISAQYCNAETYKNNKDLQKADIIIITIGQAEWLKPDMVKKDAIIIDVGINKINKKTVGDADIKNLIEKVKYITPVPGGVGPMTIAMLFENTINLTLQQTVVKSDK